MHLLQVKRTVKTKTLRYVSCLLQIGVITILTRVEIDRGQKTIGDRVECTTQIVYGNVGGFRGSHRARFRSGQSRIENLWCETAKEERGSREEDCGR